MAIRRVVVTRNGDGSSVDDGPPPRSHAMEKTPGFTHSMIWASEAGSSSTQDSTTSVNSYVPEVGGTRFLTLTVPPDTIYGDPGFDFAGAGAEMLEKTPGLAELFEQDNPGMHTTPTHDYAVVVDGDIWLDLGDREIALTHGDAVVLLGVRHAWRNKGSEPATIVSILRGVEC